MTTATTNSAIDEALSPCMLHLVDSVFDVVNSLRSLSLHSSDCHRNTCARRVIGSLFEMRSFLSVLKSPSVCVVLSLLWAVSRMLKLRWISMMELSLLVVNARVFNVIFTRRILYLNPHPTLAPKLPRNQFVFVRCSLDTVAFLSKQPVICERAPLPSVLSLSITVFGAPRLSHPSYHE